MKLSFLTLASSASTSFGVTVIPSSSPSPKIQAVFEKFAHRRFVQFFGFFRAGLRRFFQTALALPAARATSCSSASEMWPSSLGDVGHQRDVAGRDARRAEALGDREDDEEADREDAEEDQAEPLRSARAAAAARVPLWRFSLTWVRAAFVSPRFGSHQRGSIVKVAYGG